MQCLGSPPDCLRVCTCACVRVIARVGNTREFISLPPESDKGKRAAIHRFVSRALPGLETKTISCGGNQAISVRRRPVGASGTCDS